MTPAYPVDEVCVLLEGTVTLTTTDGGAQTFGPGEGFAIARGTACTWSQPGPVRKLYVIREPG
ncbi:MAG TPA: cupin domain-containing protein [Solirubrobacteraceae bacterium]